MPFLMPPLQTVYKIRKYYSRSKFKVKYCQHLITCVYHNTLMLDMHGPVGQWARLGRARKQNRGLQAGQCCKPDSTYPTSKDVCL